TRVARLCERKALDVTLSRFLGNVVKILVIIFVIIATLGNFGITIAPLIALAGASAFGATFALQGPLSNYGAGLAIILTRPFVVGNTVKIQNVSGVVEEVSLAATVLRGEAREPITV
ncbi:MAG: mechanosensitive ion channel, partial [Rhodospirillaceae bacterium]|nr:mechanosensitive ion channel [Rhodospirillaceae bacterium]